MDGNAPPALAFANLAASLNVLAPLPLDGMHAPHGSRRQAHPGGSGGSTKRQATGRTCLECGATSTPQWREGPMGKRLQGALVPALETYASSFVYVWMDTCTEARAPAPARWLDCLSLLVR
jgi:hypothetical protein